MDHKHTGAGPAPAVSEQALPEPRQPHSSDPRNIAHAEGWNACLEAVRAALAQGAVREQDERTRFKAWWAKRVPAGSDSDHAAVFAFEVWQAALAQRVSSAPAGDKHLPGWERGIATVTLDGHQLRAALEIVNPDGEADPDQLDDWLTFGIVQHRDDDGNESTGMCCWNDDSDGVMPLDGTAGHDATPASAPQDAAANAGGLPRANGVSRNAEYPTSMLVFFERELTDSEMRSLHDVLAHRAPAADAGGQSQVAGKPPLPPADQHTAIGARLFLVSTLCNYGTACFQAGEQYATQRGKPATSTATSASAQPADDLTTAIAYIADELEADAMNHDGDFADTVKGCVDALRHLIEHSPVPSAQPVAAAPADGWISVKDSLPQPWEGRLFSKSVLIVDMESRYPHVRMSELNFEEYEGEVVPTVWSGADPTHWKPAPALPGAAPAAPVAQDKQEQRKIAGRAGAAACWSCDQPYTEQQRSDADGHCPHCGVEIELVDSEGGHHD